MWPQDLKSQIVTSKFKTVDYVYAHIRYELLKNDKNIHIKGLKNDNFGDGIMLKFSTNDKWHIKILSTKKSS